MATKIPLRLSKVAGVSFLLSLPAAEHRVADRGISGQTKQTRTLLEIWRRLMSKTQKITKQKKRKRKQL